MQEKTGFWNSLYQNLASLKLTLVILLTLAVLSLIGTLLPQGITGQELQRHYSPGLAWWIDTLGLNNLYHTNWFRLCLLLLCLNLVVCTLERLPKTLKLLQRREDLPTPQKLVKFGYNRQITTRLPWEDLEARLEKTVAEDFAQIQRMETPEGYSGIAEKGRWSRLMVYVVHLSILVVLLGALMGSVLGFKGVMNIPEGAASGEVMLYSGNKSVTLPFQVRCDDFDASFYDTGAPKEYRSDLVIIDKGQEALKQTIRVNDPLEYQGVTFYQSSYGSILKKAEVELQDRDSGKSYTMTLPFRETVIIPGTKDQVEIVEYQQDLSRFGPALGIVLLKEGERESSGSWVLVKMPEFHGNRIKNYQIKVIKADDAQYTGLQVKRDPGIWTVYFGFTAMLVGIGLTFYTSHRKLWIWAGPEKSSTRIIIAGRSSKNPLAFEQEFNTLCQRLEEQLKSDEKRRKART